MVIAFLKQAYFPDNIGGAEVSTHCMASAMVKQNHDVSVYSDFRNIRKSRALGWKFNYKQCSIAIPVPARFQQWLYTYLPSLWKELLYHCLRPRLKKDRPDVLQIVHIWPWISAAGLIRKRLGIPVIIRCVGDDIQVSEEVSYGVGRDRVKRKLLADGFNEIDRAIAISETVVEIYKEAGIPEDKIIEIWPGVDNAAYQDDHFDQNAIRKNWSLPTDKQLIISVGRNHPKKGFHEMIDVLLELKQRSNDFAIVVVGNETHTLDAIAKEAGVEEDFYTIPEISNSGETQIGSFPSRQLVELYRASDIFAYPSYLETYANVAVEAMAAGIPVVLTDAPGCYETLRDGEEGFIVPVKNSKAMAEKIIAIHEDEQLRKRFIDAGLRKAERQDWAEVALRYIDVYQSTMPGA